MKAFSMISLCLVASVAWSVSGCAVGDSAGRDVIISEPGGGPIATGGSSINTAPGGFSSSGPVSGTVNTATGGVASSGNSGCVNMPGSAPCNVGNTNNTTMNRP